MPNWCECDLTLHGPDTAIDDFIQKTRGPETLLFFSAAVPPPVGLDELLDKREWAYKHWGTNREASLEEDNEWVREAGKASLFFMTAWSPPIEWLIAVSRLHPELEISLDYDEPGMDFGGLVKAMRGELVVLTETRSRFNTWLLAQEEQDEAAKRA